jgi:WD40 repeat protein
MLKLLCSCLMLLLLAAPAFSAAPPRPRMGPNGEPLPAGAIARLGRTPFRHTERARQLALSADGMKLAVITGIAGTKKTLWLWDVKTARNENRFDLGEEVVVGICWSPDGRSIALARLEEVALVDSTTGRTVRRFKSPDPLAAIAVSPDGKYLAAGCRHGLLREPNPVVLWDLKTGKELTRLEDHQTPVLTVRFSHDSSKLLSWSERYSGGSAGGRFPNPIPGVVCVHEISSGKRLDQFKRDGHHVEVAPDGKTVTAIGKDLQVHLFAKTGKEIAVFPGKRRTFLYLPDGKTLVTSTAGERICLWDAATGKRKRVFVGAPGRNAFVAGVSADGKVLATVNSQMLGSDGVRLWDVAIGRELHPVEGHQGAVSCLAMSPDGKRLISGGADRALCVWDVSAAKQTFCYDEHSSPITSVVFSPDGRTAASGDAEGVVHVWDCRTGKRRHRFEPPLEKDKESPLIKIHSLRFTPDGNTLVVAAAPELGFGFSRVGGSVSRWSVETGKMRGNLGDEGERPVIGPAGDRVASIRRSLAEDRFVFKGELLWRGVPSGKTLSRIDSSIANVLGAANVLFTQVVVSADGKMFSIDSRAYPLNIFGTGKPKPKTGLWETASGRSILHLPRAYTSLAFSPDGKILVGRPESASKSISLVDTATGQVLRELSGHRVVVTCAAFSNDGRRLYSGDADKQILVWDLSRVRPAKGDEVVDSSAKGLDKLWADLANSDAAIGYAAIRKLATVPQHSVALLRARLKPPPALPAGKIEQLVKDLDSEQFDVRERASAALEKLGELAQPALARVAAGSSSLDLVRRAERLLAKLDGPLTPEQLRLVRAITVLERAGTADAKRLLEKWSRGPAGARLTEESLSALSRWRSR